MQLLLALLVVSTVAAVGQYTCEGDNQWTLAFDAAFASAYQSGFYSTTIATAGGSLLPYCLETPNWTFSNPPKDTLSGVIGNRTIRVAFLQNAVRSAANGVTTIDTTGGAGVGTVTGVYAEYLQKMADAIGANAGAGGLGAGQITLTWVLYATSAECFNALRDGSVDVLPLQWSITGTYESRPRTDLFRASPCRADAHDALFTVLPASPYTTVGDLQTALAANTALKVGTAAGSGIVNQISGFLFNTPTSPRVTQETNVTKLRALIDANTIAATYLITPANLGGSPLTRLLTDATFSGSTGSFTRNGINHCKLPTCPTNLPMSRSSNLGMTAWLPEIVRLLI